MNEKEDDERIVEIEMERLRDFRGHPFKVTADQQMGKLIESIRRYGILNPLIVRPLPEGVYEIISGHRRKYAALHLGYRKLPVIIRVLRDEEAVISMVDANLQRESLLPSEKAFAFKMKNEALKRKAGRKKGGRAGHDLAGKKTVQIIGEAAGESPKQVQRYAIAVFRPESRARTAEAMDDVIPELQEDPDLKALLVSAMEKLKRTSDQEFAGLDLDGYREELEQSDEDERDGEGR